MEKVRIDKFLWATRLFKTRSIASSQCSKGHIKINNQIVKPSKEVKAGDIISVKSNIITRSYRIKKILDKRVGAKNVEQFIEEITSQEELLKLKLYKEYQRIAVPKRDKKGRPTKQERRQWDNFFGKS